MANESRNRSSRSVLSSVVALAFIMLLWPAMLTFDIGDWPSPNRYPNHSPSLNACGIVGAWFSYQLHYYLGVGTYPLLFFATLAVLARLVRHRIEHFGERILGVVLLVAGTSASLHLALESSGATLPVGRGGAAGYALGELLQGNLDRIGTLIVLASGLFVGLLFATDGWILKLPTVLRRVTSAFGAGGGLIRGFAKAIPRPHRAAGEGVTAEESGALVGKRAPASAVRSRGSDSTEEADDADEADSFTEDVDRELVTRDERQSGRVPTRLVTGAGTVSTGSEDTVASQQERLPARQHASRITKKPQAGPIVKFPSPKQAAAAEPYPRQIENWRLPSLSLLHAPEYQFSAQQEQVVRGQAQILERTLEEFRLEAHVVEIDTGPVITMFELKLGVGIKVSQIATLSNDIARALKAHAIRVVAPISGKNTVGIEVPNVEKETVRLKELMMLAGKRASGMFLPLFLGKDAAGEPLVEDLARMPHLLIAGTTGSGKSVCLNAMVVSMLMTQRPDRVKMIIVDPKMVEMSQFKDVPHLMCPIVTDLARAEKILAWAVTKMDERYELLAESRVKNIAAFNRLGADEVYARLQPESEEERARICTHLPYIVIIIDELADLMMTAAREVEHHLSRLAQKSRAVGVHIVVATQRPEAKVVTGLIKSNLPCRVCFRVASRMDSRIVLDQNGGEVLLGQGDMLFLPPGSHKLVRAQGTFLEDAEVHAVLQDLAGRAKPEFHPELIRLRNPGADLTSELRDPLFDDAVRVVIESQRGSVSLLQRRLTIGYSRASRLIDQMAAAGIVGEYKGSQAREVTMDLEQWQALAAQLTDDQDPVPRADGENNAAADEDLLWAQNAPETAGGSIIARR